jgi:hypothetical protein
LTALLWLIATILVTIVLGLGARYLLVHGQELREKIRGGQSRLGEVVGVVRPPRSVNSVASIVASQVARQMVKSRGEWQRMRFDVALPNALRPFLTARMKALKAQIFEELASESITPHHVRLEFVFQEVRAVVVRVPDGENYDGGGTDPPPDDPDDDQREVVARLIVGYHRECQPVHFGDQLYVGHSAARPADPIGWRTPAVPAIKVDYLTITDDPRIGGRHLLIDATVRGTVTVEDLGSDHGTFVNGKLVPMKALRTGDRIVLGSTVIDVDLVDGGIGRTVQGGAPPEYPPADPGGGPLGRPARDATLPRPAAQNTGPSVAGDLVANCASDVMKAPRVGRPSEPQPLSAPCLPVHDVESLEPPIDSANTEEERGRAVARRQAADVVPAALVDGSFPVLGDAHDRATRGTAPTHPHAGEAESDPSSSRPNIRFPFTRDAFAGLPHTAPLREVSSPPVLGYDGSKAVYWHIDKPSLGNLNMQIVGAPGTGKSRCLKRLLRQIHQRTNLLLVDPKGEYAAARLAGVTVHNPWATPMPYNPLAIVASDDPRAKDRAVIELRDSIVQSCGAGLGHKQVSRLTDALDKVVASATTDELHEVLDPELRAAIGDLTGRQLFGDGPPLGKLLESRSIVNLGDVPGDGRTKILFSAFVLATAAQNLATWPDAPHALRALIVADEAHRLTRLRPLEVLAREGRSRGAGLILSTQLPWDLPSAITAQMGTTICFSLPGSHAVAAAEHLGHPQLAAKIRALGTGSALVIQGHEDPVVADTFSAGPTSDLDARVS